MGVAIQCLLNLEVPGCPKMEGKSLAAAYCGQDAGASLAGPDGASNILALDFGHAKTESQAQSGPPPQSLLAPLNQFIAGDQGFEWHDASKGLASVRSILATLRGGSRISLAADFDFFDGDDEELTDGVIYDLEQLEKILTAADRVGARFCLTFSI